MNWMIISKDISVHKIIVVKFVVVFQDLTLNGGVVNPANVVFQLPCDQQCRLSYNLSPDSDVALLHEGRRFLHGLCEFEGTKHYCQSPPAEGWHRHFFSHLDVFTAVNNAHVVEFVKQLFCGLNSEQVICGQHFDLADEWGYEAANFIIMRVVLSVLDMIPVHHSRLSPVGLHLPVVEVHFLEEFLLVVL